MQHLFYNFLLNVWNVQCWKSHEKSLREIIFSIIYMELYRSSLDFWRTDIDKFDIFPTFRLDIMSVVWITSALCQIANNFIWKDLYYCPLMLSRIFNQRLNSFAIQILRYNIFDTYLWKNIERDRRNVYLPTNLNVCFSSRVISIFQIVSFVYLYKGKTYTG